MHLSHWLLGIILGVGIAAWAPFFDFGAFLGMRIKMEIFAMIPYERLRNGIDYATGAKRASYLLKNVRLVNVLSGEIENQVDIAIAEGLIVGVGRSYGAEEVIDCKGQYAYPGFIDAHIHLESSKLMIGEVGRIMAQNGTSAVITDPHEIANVAGLEGVKFQMACARRTPFIDVFFTSPSCVPTLNDAKVETSPSSLRALELRALCEEEEVVGLGEMMNVTGVLHSDADVLDKIEAYYRAKLAVDGHAPMLTGAMLNAYIYRGIRSDHESTSLSEAREKLRRGMVIMIREGSSERNLDALLPLIDAHGRNLSRLMFASDDLDPIDLFERGHINYLVKRAVEKGIDPVAAIQMATLSPAQYFGLDNEMGAIRAGLWANIVVSPDLKSFVPSMVFHRGVRIVDRGKSVVCKSMREHPSLKSSMHVVLPEIEALRVKAVEHAKLRVIQMVPHQIVTQETHETPRIVDGYVEADSSKDVAKVCVFDRHLGTGHFAVGFVRGFGMARGAMGSSVAHDSHPLIVVGTRDEDILRCAEIIRDMGGGQAGVWGEKSERLPLPIAGLMSDGQAENVCRQEKRLNAFCQTTLGVTLERPFAAMSFMALPVIPQLRITDRGVFKIEAGGYPERIDLWAAEES